MAVIPDCMGTLDVSFVSTRLTESKGHIMRSIMHGRALPQWLIDEYILAEDGFIVFQSHFMVTPHVFNKVLNTRKGSKRIRKIRTL